jgi:hypothetical protein
MKYMKKNFKNSSTTHASTIYLFLLSSIAKSFLDFGTDYRNTILRPRTSSLMVLTTILWKNNKLNNGLCPCVPHVSTSISSYITRKFSHSSFMFLLKQILIGFWFKNLFFPSGSMCMPDMIPIHLFKLFLWLLYPLCSHLSLEESKV